MRQVTLPSNVADGSSIEFEYYDVDGEQVTPVVIVLPIFSGQPIVTRYFARYFANQGWAAIAVDRDRDPLDDLSRPNDAIRDNLLEYRRVLDWVDQQPELDSGDIGMFGISFGGMDAVMLTALDSRVDALVAAMAGGDLAYLLMNTNYRPVSRTVHGMLESTGLSRDGLLEALESSITTDPLTLSPYVDAERVLMIMTRRRCDRAVRSAGGALEQHGLSRSALLADWTSHVDRRTSRSCAVRRTNSSRVSSRIPRPIDRTRTYRSAQPHSAQQRAHFFRDRERRRQSGRLDARAGGRFAARWPPARGR